MAEEQVWLPVTQPSNPDDAVLVTADDDAARRIESERCQTPAVARQLMARTGDQVEDHGRAVERLRIAL